MFDSVGEKDANVESQAVDGVFTDRRLSSLTGTFVVPDYQRGYRWSETEVRQLLDDLATCPDERYYLQPIVVKAAASEVGLSWELVDGQQRLTTCYLILAELHRRGLVPKPPPYQLRYKTRPGSADFLLHQDVARKDENIDFHHIVRAQTEIGRWLAQHNASQIGDLVDAIDDRAWVLWFEAPAQISGEAMFRRLNSGRIPLSDAELVKAQLIDDVPGQREVEVAAQWDGFERDLRDDTVWGFLAGGQPAAAHIALLLDALAARHQVELGIQSPPAGHRASLSTYLLIRDRIERDGGQSVWDEIVQLHSLALSWVADNDLYHRIGYLIAIGQESFSSLAAAAALNTRNEFSKLIESLVRKSLPRTFDELAEVRYDGSPGDRKILGRALLLANSESVRRAKHARFPWAQHSSRGSNWSLEHLRPQQAENLNPQARKQWLIDHLAVIDSLEYPAGNRPGGNAPEVRNRIVNAIDHGIKSDDFGHLQEDVFDLLDFDEFDSEEVHSIVNLALLDRGHNSALSNNAFEVKRRQIIGMDRSGQYVPIVTRNAFLKYFSTETIPVTYFWGRQDRLDYAKALESLLYPERPITEESTPGGAS